jgi:uncharacterized protein (TIGR02646 family)
MVGSSFWSSAGCDLSFIATFKAEVKSYYYFQQRRLCCYCSKELDRSQATYDAEHVIDKDAYPEFMFELNNLAVSCRTCNGSKGVRSVLASADRPSCVSDLASDYLVVHPHLDEWGDHFSFDDVGRIVPVAGSKKGEYTFQLCGIRYLNSARLSDYFSPTDSQAAEKALEQIFRSDRTTAHKLRKLAFLRGLANDVGFPEAFNLVSVLEAELRGTMMP